MYQSFQQVMGGALNADFSIPTRVAVPRGKFSVDAPSLISRKSAKEQSRIHLLFVLIVLQYKVDSKLGFSGSGKLTEAAVTPSFLVLEMFCGDEETTPENFPMLGCYVHVTL